MSSTSERDLIALVNGNDRAKIVASSSSSLSSALFTTSRKITEQISIGVNFINHHQLSRLHCTPAESAIRGLRQSPEAIKQRLSRWDSSQTHSIRSRQVSTASHSSNLSRMLGYRKK